MTLKLLLAISYLVVLIYTLVRILFDTHSNSKTLAYMMLVIILPLLGVVFYFSFGINYRHRKSKNKDLVKQLEVDELDKNWGRKQVIIHYCQINFVVSINSSIA